MKRIILPLLLGFTIVADVSCVPARMPGVCPMPMDILEEIHGYQSIVNTIAESIINGQFAGDTYNSLMEMTNKIGSRLSGSKNLEDSIDYMINQFHKSGLENIHTEDAVVDHWVRGYEFAEMIAPRELKLNILGLGRSVGTPEEGILGEVIVVESFDELAKIPDRNVKGKIIVFAPQWTGYGPTVQYRIRGASVASRKGAIATLVSSAGPFSIGSPHTGYQRYDEDVVKIPAAALTLEDAMLLLSLYRKGERIIIRVVMDDQNLEPVVSRNTIGELRGSRNVNNSVVIVSGHLDSWDVGVGAMDDGGGSFVAWKAVQYLKQLGLRPKRTIRTVLWTGEEFGLLGAEAYQRDHAANEKEEFNFFMESDTGTFDPIGLDFSGNDYAECIFREIMTLMTRINATGFQTPARGAPDITPWSSRGFPTASLMNKNENYFWFHHTEGDSMMLEDTKVLDRCTALFAAAAYVIADLSIDFPRTIF